MDYKNGKIYKITDNAYTKCYIGSTTQPLSKRFSKHKSDYTIRKKGEIRRNVCTAFQLFEDFGVENCKIELIEECPCENKDQLLKREGYFIKITECVNRCVAGRSSSEYYNDNKEKLKITNNERAKKHYYANQEKKKQYYIDNKKAIKEYKRRKHDCECGSIYTTSAKSKHYKTSKHQNYIKQQQENKTKLPYHAFEQIFRCDSQLLHPRTYPDYIIV